MTCIGQCAHPAQAAQPVRTRCPQRAPRSHGPSRSRRAGPDRQHQAMPPHFPDPLRVDRRGCCWDAARGAALGRFSVSWQACGFGAVSLSACAEQLKATEKGPGEGAAVAGHAGLLPVLPVGNLSPPPTPGACRTVSSLRGRRTLPGPGNKSRKRPLSDCVEVPCLEAL